MAKRKAAKKASGRKPTSGKADPKVIVLAERLGSFLGRARKKADALLGKVARPGAAKPTKRRSVAAADAPAKRLRKPPPEELFDPRLGEPMGKQMGQKNLRPRGRG